MKSRFTRTALAVMLGLFSIALLAAYLVQKKISDVALSRVAPYRHLIFSETTSLLPEIETYEKRLKSDPDGQMVMATLAGLYTQQAKLTGDLALFEHAESLAHRSLQILSFQNQAARLVLADIAQSHHDFHEAIQISQAVLDDSTTRKGSRIQAYSILVTAQLALGDLEHAAIDADRLVDLCSTVGTHMLHALVMTAQGRYDEARFDYESAYALEQAGAPTESTRLRALWGRFYLRYGEFERAEGLFKEALRITPHDPLTLGLLADLENKQHKYVAAEEHYSEAFSASKQIVYLQGQVRTKFLHGELAPAEELRAQVEKIVRGELNQPKSYGHRNELIGLLLDRGDAADVHEALELSYKEIKVRRNSETLFLHAKALSAERRWNDAEEVIREVLRTGVQDSEYYQLASLIEANRQNRRLAEHYRDRARKLDPLISDLPMAKFAKLY